MKIEFYKNTDLIDPLLLERIQVFDDEKIIDFFKDPFTFNIGIVTDNDKVLGTGVVRVINEVKMVLNPKLSNFKKASIIKTLLNSAMVRTQCSEIIVEISKGGDHYIDLLVKHYDFYETYGKVLRLEK